MQDPCGTLSSWQSANVCAYKGVCCSARVARWRRDNGGRRHRLEPRRPRWYTLGRLPHGPRAPHIPPPQQLGAWGEDAAGGIDGAPGGGTVGGGDEGEELVVLVHDEGRVGVGDDGIEGGHGGGGIPAMFLRTGRRLSPVQDAPLSSKLRDQRGTLKNGGNGQKTSLRAVCRPKSSKLG
jgi:hypothetical protein